MKKCIVCMILCGFWILATNASAAFYRYVDEQGNVHFTDDWGQVPEDQRTEPPPGDAAPAEPEPKQTPESTAVQDPDEGAAPSAASETPGATAGATGSVGETSEKKKKKGKEPTSDADFDRIREELQKRNDEINKEYKELAKEKKGIDEAAQKVDNKKPSEVKAHYERIQALNKRIREFEEKKKVLRLDVKNYTDKLVELDNKKEKRKKKAAEE